MSRGFKIYYTEVNNLSLGNRILYSFIIDECRNKNTTHIEVNRKYLAESIGLSYKNIYSQRLPYLRMKKYIRYSDWKRGVISITLKNPNLLEENLDYFIIPNEVFYDGNIISNEKLLYGYLFTYATKSEFCYDSNKKLQNILEMTEFVLNKNLDILEEKGVIKIINRNDINNRCIQINLKNKDLKEHIDNYNMIKLNITSDNEDTINIVTKQDKYYSVLNQLKTDINNILESNKDVLSFKFKEKESF